MKSKQHWRTNTLDKKKLSFAWSSSFSNKDESFIHANLHAIVSRCQNGVEVSELKELTRSIPPSQLVEVPTASAGNTTLSDAECLEESQLLIESDARNPNLSSYHQHSCEGSSLARAVGSAYKPMLQPTSKDTDINLPPVPSESNDGFVTDSSLSGSMHDEDDLEYEREQRFHRNDLKDASVEKKQSHACPTATSFASVFDTGTKIVNKKAKKTNLSIHHRTFDTSKKDYFS